jgi:hypothetical protein
MAAPRRGALNPALGAFKDRNERVLSAWAARADGRVARMPPAEPE